MQRLASAARPARSARLAVLALAGAGCETTGTGSSDVQFLEFPAQTIVTSVNLDGSVTADHQGDPELVGPKEIGIQVNMFAPTELRTILMAYWPAGQNVAERTVEITVNESFEPGPGGIGRFFPLEIPDSDELEICEGLYYMWSATWRGADGQPGLYFGQPHLVMPTKSVGPGGVIEQALCPEPPGPGV
jgi:hypothetical protein